MDKNDISDFLDFLADAVLIADSRSKIVFANAACEQLFGYGKGQLLELELDSLFGPNGPPSNAHGDMVARFITDEQPARPMMSRRVIRCRCKNGSTFPARISISNITFLGKRCAIATVQDYSHVKAEIDELICEANTDSLTGLYNKRYLHSLVNEGSYFGEPAFHYLYAYIDLNGFKLVNDTRGHDTGDTLLKSLSSRVKSSVRNTDLVLRMGGDEFLVVCKLNDIMNHEIAINILAKKIQNDIRECFNELDVYINKPFSAGIGIVIGSHKQDVGELISRADKAMYKSKANQSLFEIG